jgi:hypothetical protein
MGEAQIEYFRKALQENRDARWTLIFIHRPLWIENSYDDSNWVQFEELLGDRPYTVFAGHNHTYTKHVRNDRKHIVLATTGGGSDLSGPDHGQFDHVAWITMTPAGPQIANLMLDGIWDEDIFTSLTGRLMEQLSLFGATPVIQDGKGRLLAKPAVRFTNDEDSPVQISWTCEPHPLLPKTWTGIDSIPPNSVKDFDLPLLLDSSKIGKGLPPIEITVTAAIEPVNHRRLEKISHINLAVETLRELEVTSHGITVDGLLDEWGILDLSTRDTSSPTGRGACDFTLCRDETYLYLAARIHDDRVLPADPPARRWNHDYLELRLNPHPFRHRTGFTEQWDNWNAIYMACFPMSEPGVAQVWRRSHFPDELQVMQKITPEGYDMEIAFPLRYLRERGDDPDLAAFSLNVTMVDCDDPDGEKMLESWQPDWHLPTAVIGSGAFGLD